MSPSCASNLLITLLAPVREQQVVFRDKRCYLTMEYGCMFDQAWAKNVFEQPEKRRLLK